MQFNCPSCDASLTIDGSNLPKFCSNCGTEVAQIVDDLSSGLDETRAIDRVDLDATFSSSGVGGRVLDSEANASQVGPYSVIRKLGQGGMGTVYEAVNEKTGQVVALKLLSRSLKGTEVTVQRFRRESQIAASINHPRSTFVYDAGQHEGQFFISMELMPGGTLKEVVEENGALPFGQAVDYLLDLISGLQAAHDAGIVHRDIKPSNSFVDHDGRVKIGDFGLSKSFQTDSTLTQTGAFMGTPQYAAPEQLRNGDVSERTDIYALGGTLFFLLTGRGPFRGGAAQVITSIASETPPRVNTIVKDIPRELSRIIAQTLEKDPGKRYENLGAFRAALLPFSTRGASLADIGRRMAAFFVDVTVASGIAALLSQAVIFILIAFSGSASSSWEGMVLLVLTQSIIAITYFAIPEWLWGRSIGKWLLGMRVIDNNFETPSLIRSSVRAALIPGLPWILTTIPSAMSADLAQRIAEVSFEEVISMVTTLQLYALAGWIPAVLCMLTARASNGFRGFHEMISGTRVVRLAGALETKRIARVPVTAPVKVDGDKSYGVYQAMARYSVADDTSPILLGCDPELERRVWIFDGEHGAGKYEGDRKALGRAARLRFIAEGHEGETWQATEAVQGSPLTEIIAQRKDCSWQSIRRVLEALACELDMAIKDKTLPSVLKIDQIWIDQSGRLKFLDKSFPSRTDAEHYRIHDAADENERASGFLLEIIDFYAQYNPIPMHVREFSDELQNRSQHHDENQDGHLCWAQQQLSNFADRPSQWKWDDRLGQLAISFGSEFPVYGALVFAIGLLFTSVLSKSPLQMALLVATLTSAVAFLTGYLLSGGPTIRLSGVQVCRKGGVEVASKFRSGLRSFISWLPFITFFVGLLSIIQIQLIERKNLNDSNMSDEALPIVLFVVLPACFLIGIGVIWALVRPARGLQDLLAGTEMVRK